jgi:hypothetical protein
MTPSGIEPATYRDCSAVLHVYTVAKCEKWEIFLIENLTELTLVGGKYYSTQQILNLVVDLEEHDPDN